MPTYNIFFLFKVFAEPDSRCLVYCSWILNDSYFGQVPISVTFCESSIISPVSIYSPACAMTRPRTQTGDVWGKCLSWRATFKKHLSAFTLERAVKLMRIMCTEFLSGNRSVIRLRWDDQPTFGNMEERSDSMPSFSVWACMTLLSERKKTFSFQVTLSVLLLWTPKETVKNQCPMMILFQNNVTIIINNKKHFYIQMSVILIKLMLRFHFYSLHHSVSICCSKLFYIRFVWKNIYGSSFLAVKEKKKHGNLAFIIKNNAHVKS